MLGPGLGAQGSRYSHLTNHRDIWAWPGPGLPVPGDRGPSWCLHQTTSTSARTLRAPCIRRLTIGLMVIVKVRTLVILKIRRDRRRGASASMHKLCVFLHTFYFPDVCWHDSHYLQSAPTSAQLINGVNTEIEIPQIFTQHCIISVILPNIGVPWLALSLGCSIKNILDPGTWENLFSQISSLSTFFVFTWSNYQILFWVPTNIALWTPVIFVELPLFRVAFFSIFYFVKYGIPAFRD